MESIDALSRQYLKCYDSATRFAIRTAAVEVPSGTTGHSPSFLTVDYSTQHNESRQGRQTSFSRHPLTPSAARPDGAVGKTIPSAPFEPGRTPRWSLEPAGKSNFPRTLPFRSQYLARIFHLACPELFSCMSTYIRFRLELLAFASGEASLRRGCKPPMG